MAYDIDKLCDLLLLATAASYEVDREVKPHEISETCLPDLTEEDKAISLPKDILGSIDEFLKRRNQQTHEDTPQEAAAMMMRGDSDFNAELERQLQEREDEEFKKQEDDDAKQE